MDQKSVDELLSQVQQDAAAVAADVGRPVEDGVQQASATVAEIAGELMSPGSAGATGGHPSDELFRAPPSDVHRLLAIEVPVIVQLGMRRMTVGEVMRLAVGAIVEFHKPSDEELELLANNKPIGKGHAVKVGENFGIKITSVGPVKETIRKLGGV
jgi:flagellar motor switch protein FliN/FliY